MTPPPTPRQIEVMQENSDTLRRVITACDPLFDKNWDVFGDDDQATITLKYDDWTYLLETMKPFYPKQIEALERKLFSKGNP